jgi:hypothetical protein
VGVPLSNPVHRCIGAHTATNDQIHIVWHDVLLISTVMKKDLRFKVDIGRYPPRFLASNVTAHTENVTG